MPYGLRRLGLPLVDAILGVSGCDRACCIAPSSRFTSFASLVIPGRLSLHSPPVTAFIGPQPSDNVPAISGELALFSGDLCNANEPAFLDVAGRIVIVSAESTAATSCLFEQAYLNFVQWKARAVIQCFIDQVPSPNVWMQDGTKGANTRAVPVMYLLTGPDSDHYDLLTQSISSGYNATVYPDRNVWEKAYASPYYQGFVRGIPSAILIISGLCAAVFLSRHIALIVSTSTGKSSLRFVMSRMGLPHVTLIVEVITATLSGVILAVGGYGSTANLPFPAQTFFTTALSGCSLACSVTSNMTWTRHLTDLIDTDNLSWFTLIMIGKRRAISILLCIVPILLDTAVASCFTRNYFPPLLMDGYAIVMIIMELVIGLHLVISVIRYYRLADDVRKGVSGMILVTGTDRMASVLRRLSRCALGLGVSMLTCCLGMAIIGSAPVYSFTPEGYTLTWALFLTGRSLDSAFRVVMFKPRSHSSRILPLSQGSNQNKSKPDET